MEGSDALFWNGKNNFSFNSFICFPGETSITARPSKERLVNNLRMTIPNIGVNARRGGAVMEVGCWEETQLDWAQKWWFRLR